MAKQMNMQQMMKQAQKMQQEMLKMQEELEAKTYSAAAGGGVVRAEVSGKHELVSLTIDSDAVDPEDVEMLQDLVVAAVNEAFKKAGDAVNQEMNGMLGGMGGLGNIFG